ncbi:hypothetical protein CRG98_048303 [Punica granatum]|uniref:Uncharacterized protein n=1 Tax=Punica granatum TaxID=22663 RepID=A0A2I0HHZ9_PUNGR|nr:hypothetical protein CRG98_048303 [Punica granatum]
MGKSSPLARAHRLGISRPSVVLSSEIAEGPLCPQRPHLRRRLSTSCPQPNMPIPPLCSKIERENRRGHTRLGASLVTFDPPGTVARILQLHLGGRSRLSMMEAPLESAPSPSPSLFSSSKTKKDKGMKQTQLGVSPVGHRPHTLSTVA